MANSNDEGGHSLAWAFLDDAATSSSHTIPSGTASTSSSSSSSSRHESSSSNAAIYAEIHTIQGISHSRILTRIINEGRTLECSWLDAASQAVTRFTLEQGLTLLPGICMSSSSDSESDNARADQLSILLATSGSSHLVYRLCFDSQNGAFFSAEELSKGWHSEHRLAVQGSSSSSGSAGKTPVACHGVHGEDTLVIAYQDGSLLEAQWQPREERIRETELVKQQSIISSVRSFFPGRRLLANTPTSSPARQSPATQQTPARALQFSSSASSSEQVVSLTSNPENLPNIVFAVSRDRKLRAWSIASHTCIETVQLPSTSQTMDIVPVDSQGNAVATQSSSASAAENGVGTTSLLAPTPRTLLRFIPSSGTEAEQSHLLLVYVPTSHVQTSFFILYSVDLDSSGKLSSISPISEKPCDFALETNSSCTLVDFAYSPGSGQLWTLWSEDGQSIVRHSGLDAQSASGSSADVGVADTSSPWRTVLPSVRSQENLALDTPAALFEQTLQALHATHQAALAAAAEADGAAQPSAAEQAYQLTVLARQAAASSFLSHIFRPGRYPLLSISSALIAYLQSAKKASPELRVPSRRTATLAQQALDAVGAGVHPAQEPATGALMEREYAKMYKMEWMRFLALAEEGRRAAVLPLTLALEVRGGSAQQQQDEVIVTSREGLAALAQRDEVAGVWQAADDNEGPSEGDAKTVFGIATLLHTRLDSAVAEECERAIVQAATSPLGSSLEDYTAEIYESALEAHIDDQLAEELTTRLGSVQIASAVRSALASLSGSSSSAAEGAADADMDRDESPANALAQALQVDLASASLVARYHLSIRLFMLLLFIQGEMLHPDPSLSICSDLTGDEAESAKHISEDDLADIVAVALDTVKTLSVAHWTSVHNIQTTDLDVYLSDPAIDEEASDEVLQRLIGGLQMQSKSRGNGQEQQQTTQNHRSVLAVLMGRSYADHASGFAGLSASVAAYLARAGFLGAGKEGLSSEKASLLAWTLLQQGYASESLQLIDMLLEREEDAALLHIRGCIAAQRGLVEDAETCFSKAAGAIYTEDPSAAGLQAIVEEGASDSIALYYRCVVSIFETANGGSSEGLELPVARFCRLAIDAEAAQSGDSEDRPAWVKELWNKEFRSYCNVGHFDAAYASMMGMPFTSLQQDSLRHLVAVMCESGVIDVLLRYTFVGLHGELEKTLSFRARNSHPLDSSVDYYKVLFAFHTTRSDYRAAAAVMYQKAKRLAALSGSDIRADKSLTAGCQAYLTAVNSLSLVEKDQQWILVRAEGDESSSARLAAARKYQRVLDAPLADPDVITLNAIRTDYVSALARLQLSQHFPELNRGNKFLDSANAVALFSQIGAFDNALRTGLALEVNMSSIFEHLTRKCVQLGHDGSYQEESDLSWLLQDSNASTWEGSVASKAWRLLELQLVRFDDTAVVPGRYRERVLQTILEEDRRTRLPRSLINWFMEHHPEHLIWKLVEYDLLEEAFEHAKAMVAKSDAEVLKSAGAKRAAITRLPYNLLDQLLLVDLEDEVQSRKEAIAAQQEQLRKAVKQQNQRVEQMWRQM